MTMERFSRTELLLGKEKLVKLQNSTICVIGLGAVGCYALEGLARAGVGSFILVDFDFIRPSNINRQILALESTLNIPKVMAAEERVKNINPDATVRTFQFFIDAESIKSVLALKPDIIIDAIDSLNPKSQLITAVYKSGIQIISSMGAATRIDPGKIRIADLMDTKVCPLAASLRRTLKEAGVGRGVQCVYSEEAKNVHAVSKDPIHDPNEFSRGRARNRLGSLSTITGIFGLTIANEAILTLVRTK